MIGEQAKSSVPPGTVTGQFLQWNGARWVPVLLSFKNISINAGGDSGIPPLSLQVPADSFAIYIAKKDATPLLEVDDSGLAVIAGDALVSSPASGLKGFVLEQPDGAIKLLGAPSLTSAREIVFPELDGTVALTNQVAIIKDYQAFPDRASNIAVTDVADSSVAGFYRLSIALETTAEDAIAGTVTLACNWSSGFGQTTVGPLDLTNLHAQVNKVLAFYHDGTSPIKFSTTHTGSFASSEHLVNVLCEKVA